jgi:hypothetical protein
MSFVSKADVGSRLKDPLKSKGGGELKTISLLVRASCVVRQPGFDAAVAK